MLAVLSYNEWKTDDWVRVVPIALVSGAVAAFLTHKFAQRNQWVNLTKDKCDPKIVHTVDVEDLGDKKVFCRCWKSSQFPYCDGSHTEHNRVTGDNVGPLIVKKR